VKIRIPVEQVEVGDIDPKTGKKVVDVLNRASVRYIRATLEGGWPLIDGYYGTVVEVEREETTTGGLRR
jgi:hypothetical protein